MLIASSSEINKSVNIPELSVLLIRWMIVAIIYSYFSKFEWNNTLQTGHVKTVLLRIGALLMMSIDTTTAAKIVFCGHRFELIEAEKFDTRY